MFNDYLILCCLFSKAHMDAQSFRFEASNWLLLPIARVKASGASVLSLSYLFQCISTSSFM